MSDSADRLDKYRKKTGSVESRDDVMRIEMSVPKRFRDQLRDMADSTEYANWHYSARVRHNTPVAEMIWRDFVKPDLGDPEDAE